MFSILRLVMLKSISIISGILICLSLKLRLKLSNNRNSWLIKFVWILLKNCKVKNIKIDLKIFN